MLVFKLVGIALLVSMAFLDNWIKASTPGQRQHSLRVTIVAGIYVVRTGLMNCTYPLEESLLMDHVPKCVRASRPPPLVLHIRACPVEVSRFYFRLRLVQALDPPPPVFRSPGISESPPPPRYPRSARARWKSLDSISVFGWCGSAALGGYLADRYSYSATFLVTAAIQLVGTLVQIPLLFIARRHEAPERGSTATATATATAPLRAAPVRRGAEGGAEGVSGDASS
jgi:hypothetical protein